MRKFPVESIVGMHRQDSSAMPLMRCDSGTTIKPTSQAGRLVSSPAKMGQDLRRVRAMVKSGPGSPDLP